MTGDDTGLEARYTVRKIDDPTGKHTDCRYFVLDPQHDPLAVEALLRYSQVALDAGYVGLAADLRLWLRDVTHGRPPVAPPTEPVLTKAPRPSDARVAGTTSRPAYDVWPLGHPTSSVYDPVTGRWTEAVPLPMQGVVARVEERLRARGWRRVAGLLARWDERNLGR